MRENSLPLREAVVNGVSTLADVADWAGATGEVHTQLMNALGTPAMLRDIACKNPRTALRSEAEGAVS